MKKFIFIIVFVSTCIQVQSQNIPLVKEGAIWRETIYAWESFYPFTRQQYVMQGDTIINNKEYKKVYETNFDSIITQRTYVGAMREDSLAKVFFIRDPNSHYPVDMGYFNDSIEKILYDFTLQVGDTMTLHLPSASTEIVYTIDTLLICGSFRKVFNANFSRSWIEGIGDTHGLFAPCILEFEHIGTLICYEDSMCFWQNPFYSVCVYPNPANNYLNIDLGMYKGEFKFEIYNTIGQHIKTNVFVASENYTIDISNLPKGVYFYNLIKDSRWKLKSDFFIVQ